MLYDPGQAGALSKDRIVLRDEPYAPFPDETWMELRLTYAGQLLGSANNNPRADHKHAIRRVFHEQIRTFWHHSRVLTQRTGNSPAGGPQMPYVDWLAEKFELGGFGFIPLVTESLSLSCSLDILMLRPRDSGGLIAGGDIDNRLKTLFDALRKPQNTHELAGATPSGEREPFYCLLEDDRLITRISVETDTLLEAVNGGIRENDVRLVVTARVLPFHAHLNNLDFVGN